MNRKLFTFFIVLFLISSLFSSCLMLAVASNFVSMAPSDYTETVRTGGDVETQAVIPIDKMKEMFEKIPARKGMARKTGMEHGQMLYSSDGYVTAWFMWVLKGDENAAKAFSGENPELLTNKLYSDQKLEL